MKHPSEILQSHLPSSSPEDDLKLLVGIIEYIRPSNPSNFKYAKEKILEIIGLLESDNVAKEKFRRVTGNLLTDAEIGDALEESGMLTRNGFFQELSSKLRHKFLPPVTNHKNFKHLIGSIFNKTSDWEWVEEIDNEVWVGLFNQIAPSFSGINPKIKKQLFNILTVLSYKLAALGLEKEVFERLENVKREIESPFLMQNKLIGDWVECWQQNQKENTKLTAIILEKLTVCENFLKDLKQTKSEKGTSLYLTYCMLRMEQLIERITLIIDILDESAEYNTTRFCNIFKELVYAECNKNDISEFMSQNLVFLSYQIAEHEGKTGEHYITKTKEEYAEMFRSAAGGGLVISFTGVIKAALNHLTFAPFWQHFTYSINYAAGFVGIQILGFTLATKQPAMTASALASSIDSKKNDKPDLVGLANITAQMTRSQIASFAGNLMVVFPLAYFFAMGLDVLFDVQLATPKEAIRMVRDQHPFKSPALLFACFTGFFLFLSGIVSGYYDNLLLYSNIPERLKHHVLLKRLLGNKLNPFIIYLSKNLGTLAGNISLGFFLGFAGFLGKIFGLLFDIRHITISTAFFSIGLYFAAPLISGYEIIIVAFGIAGIGFLNFLVSFSLAFWVAVKSRNIKFRDYKRIFTIILRYFIRYPQDFLFPTEKKRDLNAFT